MPQKSVLAIGIDPAFADTTAFRNSRQNSYSAGSSLRREGLGQSWIPGRHASQFKRAHRSKRLDSSGIYDRTIRATYLSVAIIQPAIRSDMDAGASRLEAAMILLTRPVITTPRPALRPL